MPRTLTEAAVALAAGTTTAAALTEAALARIADPAGEGARAFITVHAETAPASAAAMDALRAAGRAPSAFAGIPISVKDLYDEAGFTTASGSVAMKGAPAAKRNAPTVQRLLRAGFVILGRTNQVEFAFSGLGVNPHFGTPKSPWDRATGRLPGGSSSGAGVAAADGMGFAALGTGHRRVVPHPGRAVRCGGLEADREARADRRHPAARGLRSIPPGRSRAAWPIAPSWMRSWRGEEDPVAPVPLPLKGLRLGLPRGTFLTDGMDGTVAAVFGRTLTRLSAAGAVIVEFDLPELAEIPTVNAAGGFAASEAWSWHRWLIAAKADTYDPRILKRIQRGERMTAADYVELVQARARIIAAAAPRTAPFDAVICPTCPIVPPAIAEVEEEAPTTASTWRAAAQHQRGQLPRPLLDQPALPCARRAAGRADADRRAHGRRPPVPRSGFGRGGAGWLDVWSQALMVQSSPRDGGMRYGPGSPRLRPARQSGPSRDPA